MLVDINLLPKREKRNPRFTIFLIALLIAAILLTILFLWQYSVQKKEVESLDRRILQVRDASATLQENLQKAEESGNSAAELQEVIRWAEEFPIDTVFVLNKLSALLPDRGFFKEFSYMENGSVQLTVQFDTSRQAAYYLTELSKSNLISEADVVSVTTEEADTERSEATEESGEFLPRYIAVYEINLDEQAVKKAGKEKEKTKGEEDSDEETE